MRRKQVLKLQYKAPALKNTSKQKKLEKNLSKIFFEKNDGNI